MHILVQDATDTAFFSGVLGVIKSHAQGIGGFLMSSLESMKTLNIDYKKIDLVVIDARSMYRKALLLIKEILKSGSKKPIIILCNRRSTELIQADNVCLATSMEEVGKLSGALLSKNT